MKGRCTACAYALLFTGLIVLCFGCGGLAVTLSEERVDPATRLIALLGGSVAIAALLSMSSAWYLFRGGALAPDDTYASAAGEVDLRRKVAFRVVLFVLLFVASLASLNAAALFFAIPWPMSGLHGVSREVGKQAWNYLDKGNGFVQVNSWGQRDREHSLRPDPGSYRMIFIGDSLLEDGAAIPMPVRMEEKLKSIGLASHEIINLGVSATEPDEYFFRLKKVGLPLQPRHCVLFFSVSSDFIQEPSLLSFGGIIAPYPRDALLDYLGLRALNQVLSNRWRPIMRAWFEGGPLLKHETKLAETFRNTRSDAETEAALLSFFPRENQFQIRAALQQASPADRATFYAMLRHPDDAKFRSHYLNLATRKAMGEPLPQFIPAEYSFRWVKLAYELCRKNGVAFTLVVIPDGFSVDTRMAQQWRGLYNMRDYMQPRDAAASRLVRHALDEGMEVVDLRPFLKDKPGAYLNMDGHWSQYGADLVAEHLAGLIRSQAIGKMTTLH